MAENAENISDMYNEVILSQQVTDRLIESAQKYMLNMNPIERILKQMDTSDENLRKSTADRVNAMMNDWIQSYTDALKEGKDLPKDLIGQAADLAKRMREKRTSKAL